MILQECNYVMYVGKNNWIKQGIIFRAHAYKVDGNILPVNILLLDEAAGLLHLGHFTAFGFAHRAPFATRTF